MRSMRFGLITIAYLVLFSASAFAEVKKMTFVCEDKEDFPALMSDGSDMNATKPGVAVEILKTAGKNLGVEIEIRRVPWKRALEIELATNIADGLFPVSFKKEREVFGAYPMKDGKVDESRRFSTLTYSFYRLKNSGTDYDGNELSNLKGKIGAPRGYSIVDDLRKKGYTVEESNSTLSDLKKLSLDRVGAVAALEMSGDYILRANPDLNGSVEKISKPISTKSYYFMLSHGFVKSNPELAEKLWDEIAAISQKNYDVIIKKYLE